MEQGSTRWYLKVRLICYIALCLTGYYNGPVIVDGGLHATYRETQKLLFRTMRTHLGQRQMTTLATQQPATGYPSSPLSYGERDSTTFNGSSPTQDEGSPLENGSPADCNDSAPTTDDTPTPNQKRPFSSNNEHIQNEGPPRNRGCEESLRGANEVEAPM